MTPLLTTNSFQLNILEQVTPLILTYNEEANIRRVLNKLTWAKNIIIVDSYSTDNTLSILEQYPQVTVIQRHFDTHGKQWDFGRGKIDTEWVLSLDADYVLSESLISEITSLNPTNDITAYSIQFKYCIFGVPINQTILPPRPALFRQSQSKYIDDGHTQFLITNGKTLSLKHFIFHDDRKPLSRWLWAQDRYMIIEARKLSTTTFQDLSWGDRIRKMIIPAPFIMLLYCLIWKGGLFDGWRGLYYIFQRTFAELLLSIRLVEIKLNPDHVQ